MTKPPVKITITGAGGQIAYSLLSLVARGAMLGEDQPVILQLLEVEPVLPMLKGLVMELEDCCFPLLEKVVVTSDPMVAFDDSDFALLVGAMPRRPGMERKDLLKANIQIFQVQGAAIDKVAKKSIKVVVVGNPANTNCLICARFAPSIPKENFTALTRLDMNRGLTQLALRLDVPVSKVCNVIIWGNHSSTQFVDARYALLQTSSGTQPVPSVLNDDAWLKTTFLTTVQKRGAAVLDARKASSAMSAAKAIVEHMRDWWLGTPAGKWVTMAVHSDGSYGVPKGLFFSFPVHTQAGGKWTIVKDLAMDSWAAEMMQLTTKELEAERNEALSIVQ